MRETNINRVLTVFLLLAIYGQLHLTVTYYRKKSEMLWQIAQTGANLNKSILMLQKCQQLKDSLDTVGFKN